MFQTNHPVIGPGFHDRTAEMERLATFVAELRAGESRWLAIIGPRKVGKTSMILELSRRITEVDFVMVDTQEVSPPSPELFRTCALRVADQVLGRELANSLEVLAATEDEFNAVLDGSATFTALPARLKTTIRALARAEMTDDFARLCLDLPEQLAETLQRHIVIAIDEFQELAGLTRGHDVLPIIRSTWQRHRRVGYVVSGSGRTLLENMVTQQHSPFFQHFSLMYVEPFARAAAIELLTADGGPGRPVPVALAERAVSVLGGHPFYLQLLGEALTAREPPYDDAAFKEALQDVLFSRTGRLALYFQLGFDRAVGRSTYLAAVLDALSAGALRMTDIAARIRASTADTARYLERLGDVVRRLEGGRYELDDPVFGLWLRWRRPGGTVVPMTVIGDAAERDVATVLAQLGFDLVYQARASRGAFDLLATRGPVQLGIQVKRSALPLAFRRADWQRMAADAKRLGWRWAVASVDPAGATHFLDPAKARRGETVRLGKPAIIENLVAWFDG
jgi:AAA+ ATPase superfamily predicted ATPase/Holliday junction resolvase